MTNKFRRSVTSVLLAASLLFSSQSVIAFADYGSKSDASDLSPVQESVEPVIGESTPMMMAMPLSGNTKEFPYNLPDFDGLIEKLNNASISIELECTCNSCPTGGWWGSENKKQFFLNTLLPDNATYNDVCQYITFVPVEGDSNKVKLTLNEYQANRWIEGWIAKDGHKHHVSSEDLTTSEDVETILIYNNGWAEGADTAGTYDFNISGNSIKPVDPTDPEIPEDILKKIQVRFDCETNDQHDVNSNHNLVDDFTEGEHYTIEFFEDDTKATITLQGDKLVEYYDTKHPGETHQFKEMTRGEGTNEEKADSISLTLNGDKWEFDNKGNPNDIHFTVKMNCTPEVPEKPYAPNLDELLGNVSVVCDTAPKSHNTSYSFKDLSEGAEYTVTRPTLVDNVYQCTVSVNAQAILNKYNGSDATHTLVEEASVTGPVTLTWKNNEWTVDNFVKGSLTVKIHCESEPWTPIVPFPTDDNIKALLNGKIQVVCDTVKEHAVKTYGGEVEGGYTPSNEIKFDGTNYTYDLTINYAPYVEKYNDEPNAKKHGLVGTVNSYDVVLKWVPEKDGIAAHWALENDADPLVTIPVKCDIPFLTETDLAKGFIKFECLNNEEHDSSSTYLNNFVDGTFNIRYDAGKAIVTPANPVSLVSNWKSGHMYVKSNIPEQITFTYSKDTGWAVNGSDTITMYMLCGPTEEEVRDMNLELTLDCITTNGRHNPQTFNLSDTNIPITISAVPSSVMPISDEVSYNVFVGVDTEYCLAQYNDTHGEHTYATNNPEAIFVLEWDEKQPMAAGAYEWKPVSPTSLTLNVEHEVTNPGPGPDPDPDPNPNPGGGDNDDDDDRYTGGNTVTRTINDDDVPLNDRPTNTTTIDDEDVPLADLPDDTVTIDDGEVPLKDNPSTGDSLPFAAMAAAALSLGGVIVLNRKKK